MVAVSHLKKMERKSAENNTRVNIQRYNNTTTSVPVNATFENINPFLNKSGECLVGIEQLSVPTDHLPFIDVTNHDLTYVVTIGMTDYSRNVKDNLVSEDSRNGKKYFIYSYSQLCDAFNNNLREVLVANAVDENKRMLFEYDSATNSIHCLFGNLYSFGTYADYSAAPYIVKVSPHLYQFFGYGFSCVRNTTESGTIQSYTLTALKTSNYTDSTIYDSTGTSKTYKRVKPDFMNLQYYHDIEKILICTTLGLKGEIVDNKSIAVSNLNSANINQSYTVLTDFQYKPYLGYGGIYYSETGRCNLRLVNFKVDTDIQNFDITVFYQKRNGSIYQLYTNSNTSYLFKLNFTRA